jgi:hypothetical protein
MTDTTQTADAVDSIIDAEIPAAVTEKTEVAETQEGDAPAEQKTPKTYTEEDWARSQRDLERERRRIGKITAQKYQFKSEADTLRAQIAELQKKIPQPTAPDITQYQDVNKYWQDTARFQAEQVAAQNKPPAAQTGEDPQRIVWRETRKPVLVSQIQAASQTFPDIQQKFQQNVQLLDSLPSTVADAFLEADNGALAIYQLLEDGMIPHLAGMSPETVTAMIERAEDKALSRQKPQTKAPAPMTAARGTALGSIAPENMTPDQMRKWMAS